MSVISYMKQFGVRSTLIKAQSVIIQRLMSKGALEEDSSKDLNSLEDATSIDTAKMSSEYKTYVDEQIARSVRRSTYLNPLRAKISGRDQLIQQISRVANNWKLSCEFALSIGCRDDRELDSIIRLLRSKGVTGVDLFSASPRILAADMHDLPFEDDRFDVSIAIHSMEHSYDSQKSLSEMLRVTKQKGLMCIEVPIGFPVTEFDRNDFQGIFEIVSILPQNSVSIVWAELENREDFSKPPTMRVILQKKSI